MTLPCVTLLLHKYLGKLFGKMVVTIRHSFVRKSLDDTNEVLIQLTKNFVREAVEDLHQSPPK